MNSRRTNVVMLGSLMVCCSVVAASLSQQPDRLVIDNRSGYWVSVEGYKPNGWQFVTRVSPQSWAPVYGVYQNEQYRATVGNYCCEYHQVYLVYNDRYGGRESVFEIEPR